MFIIARALCPALEEVGLVVNKLLHEATPWAKKKYAAQISANSHRAPKLYGDVPDRVLDIHTMTWFIFKWVNPDTEITPAEEFARGPNGSPDLVNAAGYLTQLFYDTFRVLEMRNDWLGVVDSYTTGEVYTVIFRVRYDGIKVNDLFAAYIHPWRDGAYYTIGSIRGGNTLPREFITPGMTNMLMQRLLDERQERYESVSITNRTGIKTYLKSQSAEHVTKVAKSLGITDGIKKRKIMLIWDTLTGDGIVDAVRSLPRDHMQCLTTVAVNGFMKRHVLKRQADGNEKAVLDLYERGLFMLGTKIIKSKRHKIVAVPADVLLNMKEHGLLNLRA